LRDVLLEGHLEDTPGKGAFGRDRWVPRYAVYNTVTKRLDIYVEFGNVEGSYEVVTGTAVNRGKTGPLGRRFKVEVKNTNLGEPENKPWWNSFLLHSAKEAQMWTAVFNGSEIREEDKKEEIAPEPEVVKPKEVQPKFLQANPWKTKEVVDSNIINTGVGAGAFSRFHSKPQQPPPMPPKGERPRSPRAARQGSPRAARPEANPGASVRGARGSAGGAGGDETKEEPRGDCEEDGDGEAPKYTIAQLFEMLDADGDGSLTLAEVVGGADTLDMSEEEATKLFKQLDSDGSGSLSKTEFEKFKAPAAWDTKKAVAKPKLTAAAGTATPRFLQPVAFKIKGAEVLKPKAVEEVKPKLTEKAESASPRFLQPVQFKIKGAKVLEDAKKPIEIKNFKAREVKVLSRAPKIPVAISRLAAAGFATYKKGSLDYAQFEDGDWYPAMVAVVRVTPAGAEEYDVEFEGFADFEKDAFGLTIEQVAPVSEFEDDAPVARGANAENFVRTLDASPPEPPLKKPPSKPPKPEPKPAPPKPAATFSLFKSAPKPEPPAPTPSPPKAKPVEIKKPMPPPKVESEEEEEEEEEKNEKEEEERGEEKEDVDLKKKSEEVKRAKLAAIEAEKQAKLNAIRAAKDAKEAEKQAAKEAKLEEIRRAKEAKLEEIRKAKAAKEAEKAKAKGARKSFFGGMMGGGAAKANMTEDVMGGEDDA